MIIWITGFSGAGKTTVAKLLQQKLKEKKVIAVLLDGDELRKSFKLTGQYSWDERRKIAYSYANLAKLIADQGIMAIVATISMFEEVRQWNRENNENYFEIYLKVPEEERKRRDPKKLYVSEEIHMVTQNEIYQEPQNPDLVFDYNDQLSSECTAEKILEKAFEKREYYK